MTYVLTTDSSSDTSREYLEERNIGIINYKYELDGEIIEDNGGKSLSYDDFYKKLEAGSIAKTSAINSQEFIDFFSPYLAEGYDIVHVMLSSGLSSTCDNAVLAKKELEEEYPQRKIYLIDSLMASSGVTLLVDQLADLRDKGYSGEELTSWAEENRGRVQAFYTTTDLRHFVRGGRISAPVGWIGGKLNICPVMSVDKEGKLYVDKVVRSKKKAMKTLVDEFDFYSQRPTKVELINAMMHDEVEEVKDKLIEKYPDLEGKIRINRIGTTIGSHTGPETLGIFFWSEKDRWENSKV